MSLSLILCSFLCIFPTFGVALQHWNSLIVEFEFCKGPANAAKRSNNCGNHTTPGVMYLWFMLRRFAVPTQAATCA